MYKTTPHDRLKMKEIRFWKGLHSKYRKSRILFLRLSAWRAKRNVKELDSLYFRSRVQELLEKAGVGRNNLVGSGLHPHYSAFLFLIQNMDRIQAPCFPEDRMHLLAADKPVTIEELVGMTGIRTDS